MIVLVISNDFGTRIFCSFILTKIFGKVFENKNIAFKTI